MFNIGTGEIVVIAVVALLVLGPKRLPELARGIGKFLREFRRQTDEVRGVVEREFYKMDNEINAPPPVPAPPCLSPRSGRGARVDAARTTAWCRLRCSRRPPPAPEAQQLGAADAARHVPPRGLESRLAPPPPGHPIISRRRLQPRRRAASRRRKPARWRPNPTNSG